MITFFLARVVSGALCDVGTFALMVKVFKINDIIAKVVTQIMVIYTNSTAQNHEMPLLKLHLFLLLLQLHNMMQN